MNTNLFHILQSEAFRGGKAISQYPNGVSRDWIFDIRKILLNTKNADTIFYTFWEQYKSIYPFQIAGETLAGVLLVQLLSLEAKYRNIDINAFIVREERKSTGLQKHIEGEILDKIPIVIVDDIFNGGDTIAHTVEILKNQKHKIHSLWAFVNYESETGKRFLESFQLKIQSPHTLKEFVTKKEVNTWVFEVMPAKLLWHFLPETQNFSYPVPKSSPCQDSEQIFFGTHSGYFYALKKSDGSISWKYKTGYHIQEKSILSAPILYDNLVIFGSYDGNLYALDTISGKEIWRYDDADWIGSSPAISKEHELVFIGLEFGIEGRRGGIAAVDTKTGTEIWKDFFTDYVHCSPAYSSAFDVVVIGSNCGYVRLYDAKTGEKYWELFIGSAIKSSFCFDEKRGYICFGAFDGYEYIVDVSSGKVLAQYKTESSIYSAPLIQEHYLYFTSTDKNIYRVDFENTKQLRYFLTSGKILSAPTLWKNFVVFGSNDGKVYFIDFDAHQAFYIQCTERVTNKILFDKNHCYVHLFNNEVFAFSLEI